MLEITIGNLGKDKRMHTISMTDAKRKYQNTKKIIIVKLP